MNQSTENIPIENAGFTMNCRGKLISLDVPLIMGILNLTPDSFSDGGKFNNEKSALQHTEKMVKEGASIIDIGPQSTRPQSELLRPEEEIARIGNLISKIRKEFPETLISLDTFYAEVVEFGYNEGIDIVNDISGANYDPKMFETVGKTGLPYILMHVNPTYHSMHEKLIEEDIILNLNQYFSQKILELKSFGVKDIILDPGFGFGKTVEQNYQMMNELEFIGFGKYPLLVGISRKSFIYKLLGKTPLEINDETQKLHHQALQKGVKILRVHDVAEAYRTVQEFLDRKN